MLPCVALAANISASCSMSSNPGGNRGARASGTSVVGPLAGREAGAGPKYELSFRDRLVITIELRVDGAETLVRRPKANRPGRRAFVSGKRRQNTIKTTTFSDHQGRM
jgi:hypothetical protein